jgi:myo-inositol 2-dehydrogenase / D-chiro-inositol 1-dehydrogenase
MFLDMTIHDFDMARFLSAAARWWRFHRRGVMVDPAIGEAGDVDTAVITLRFANGAIGTIDNSRKAVYGYDQRVEVFGSGGMLQALNNTPTTISMPMQTACRRPNRCTSSSNATPSRSSPR